MQVSIKQRLDKQEGVEEYMRVLALSDRIPTVYCSASFLRGNPDLVYIEDALGFKGFYSKQYKTYFIPPFIFRDGKPVFPSGIAVVEFPFAARDSSLKFDVQHILSREAIMYECQKSLNTAKIFLNEYFISAMPFGSELEKKLLPSCKYFLEYLSKAKDSKNKKHLTDVIPNARYLKWLFFKNYGQHRMILYYKEKVHGILIWDENDQYYNLLFFYGKISNITVTMVDWDTMNVRKMSRANLEFPEVLLVYEFARRLPSGSLINSGGCGECFRISKALSLVDAMNTHEIRTALPEHPFGYTELTGRTYNDDFQKCQFHKFTERRTIPEYMRLSKYFVDPDTSKSLQNKKHLKGVQHGKHPLVKCLSFRDIKTPYKDPLSFPEYIYPIKYAFGNAEEIAKREHDRRQRREIEIERKYKEITGKPLPR